MTAPNFWPSSNFTPDPTFVALACDWTSDSVQQMLGFVWTAYDAMCTGSPAVQARSLERSITQLLAVRINDAMSGDEPYIILHEAFEWETMALPPAQPPAYDLAFVLRTDENFMWPLEAKVLETPGTLADYERDVRDQFLTCRYAPFSNSGAMLGYLLSGSTSDALNGIAKKLKCSLEIATEFPLRPHCVSKHQRVVPLGKAYPAEFECHHLILEFLGLARYRE